MASQSSVGLPGGELVCVGPFGKIGAAVDIHAPEPGQRAVLKAKVITLGAAKAMLAGGFSDANTREISTGILSGQAGVTMYRGHGDHPAFWIMPFYPRQAELSSVCGENVDLPVQFVFIFDKEYSQLAGGNFR